MKRFIQRFLSSGRRKFICGLLLCMLLLLTTACAGAPRETPLQEGTPPQTFTVPGSDAPKEEQEMTENIEEMRISVAVGGSSFPAVLEENEAAKALLELLEKEPVVLEMRDYAGFEKVGALGRSLPASDRQTTTQAGDIVLYQSNQIVIFYGSNAWSYTRLGRIEDLTGWEEALGSGDVTVSFSLAE